MSYNCQSVSSGQYGDFKVFPVTEVLKELFHVFYGSAVSLRGSSVGFHDPSLEKYVVANDNGTVCADSFRRFEEFPVMALCRIDEDEVKSLLIRRRLYLFRKAAEHLHRITGSEVYAFSLAE